VPMAAAQPGGITVGVTSAPTTLPAPAQAPPTGLIGAEQAITGGMDTARADLTQAMGGIDVNPAGDMQAALTGALGPEAQQQAQAQMSQSPAAQYQMEQMQRATERSAAARGGLMGGNVLQELQRNAAGIASQDYQNQFANIGEVANRRLQQEQMKASLSRDLADTAFSAGIQTGGMRTRAGEQIAQNASSAASQLSALLNQQGIAVSDMMSRDISTITDMIYQSGMQETVNTSNLASILANISGGQQSNVIQGNQAIGQAQAAGIMGIGNAVQGGVAQGIALGGIGATPPPQNQVGMVGTGQNYAGYA
ncbi:MAG TPA: hypothetical protein VF982_01875, partial [Anaerolineales bacterium]